MEQPNDKIRNFVVISHVDHGKSTLADRFLELTNTIQKDKMKPQYLDSMDLEREKGITIKMHPVRLIWRPNQTNTSGFEIKNLKFKIPDSEFILNLIDTPGHIDFSYEISRALACVEGAILLVDVLKGIQAQTLFNLEQAKAQGLKIIGVVSKIDLADNEQIAQTKKELACVLNVPEEEILSVSAKNGLNVKELLETVVDRIPWPEAKEIKNANLALRQDDTSVALIFDSKYDPFSGVVAYLRLFEGEIKKGDKFYLVANSVEGIVKEVGYFSPELKPSESLKSGEIGYIKTGIKEPGKVKVGETLIKLNRKILNNISDKGYCNGMRAHALPGYKEPQPVLFLSLYPEVADNFEGLKDALSKLKLNDPALEFQIDSQMALGRGLRLGFLGSLHAEIAIRRLKNEFSLDLIATSAQVVFKILTTNKKEIFVSSPSLWPDVSQIQEMQEPWVKIELLTPNFYFNQIFKVLTNFKVLLKETKSITTNKLIILAEAPLRTIISGSFYDSIKGSTQGYGSFSFQQLGFRKADLVKLDILIAGWNEEAFSRIVSKEESFSEGKKIIQKLKTILPSQQFAVSLQAAIGGKIIARETIRALRKDVTAPLYGGDITRKRKLLDIQKKGKKELMAKGKINIPARVFLEMLK